MFKAIFPFKGTIDGTLNFQQNDLLTVIQPIDQNWYFGCLKDSWGFIPIKYVQEIEEKDYEYMTRSVAACIEKLKKIPEKKASKDERSALRKLLKYKDALLSELATVQQQQQKLLQEQQEQLQEQRVQNGDAKSVETADSGAAELSVPHDLARALLAALRHATAAPHGHCVRALRLLLAEMARQLGAQSQDFHNATAQLIGQLDCQDLLEELAVCDSEEWQALDKLLSSVQRRAAEAERRPAIRVDGEEDAGAQEEDEDGQEEDEEATVRELQQLAELVATAQPQVACRRLQQDSWRPALQFADMLEADDSSASKRRALLHVLAAVCSLHECAASALLASRLPRCLLRYVQLPAADDSLRAYSLQLLALLLCTRLPDTLLPELAPELFVQLLGMLESQELLLLPLATFVLAVNLHLGDCDTRLAPALLQCARGADMLLLSLLSSLQRDEDPTALLDHSPPPCDSVLKLLTDLLRCDNTAELMTSSRLHQIVDSVLQRLASPQLSDKALPQLLQLLDGCVSCSVYQDSFYRSAELRRQLRHLAERTELQEQHRICCRSLSQRLFKGVFI